MAGITLSGVNGIDWNSILDAVMQSEGLPLKAIQDEQTKIQNKDSALVSLAGIISALQAPVASLAGANEFDNVSANSSDTSIATVSAGEGGIVGQYDVSISQRAKGQVTKSTNGYSASTDVAATGGEISFTINGQTTDPIMITSATTLADLKQQINSQNSGVIASIVNDGANFKLVISSRQTGETNGFTINNSLANAGGVAIAFAAGQSATSGNAQDAQNAQFTVNGVSIESASNKVTDAIPGATINLFKNGDVTIDLTSDTSGITNSLRTIVVQYNKLRQFYAQQAKGSLGGDPVLRQVLSDIKKAFLSANPNGSRYQYLSEVGLELTSNGDLKLDESKLQTAISSYPDDLEKLFQGATGTDGAFSLLKSTLSNLDGSAGLIKTTRDNLQLTLDKYRDRIDRQQNMLETRRQDLLKQYTAADQAISQLHQMTTSISNLQRSL
jgi:flagellar hook-associated protein 2